MFSNWTGRDRSAQAIKFIKKSNYTSLGETPNWSRKHFEK